MVFSFYPGFSPEEASLTMAGIWWLLWSLQSSTRPKKAQLVYSNAESRDKQSSETTQKGAAVPMYVSVIYKLYIYIYSDISMIYISFIYQWHINDLWWFMGHFLCTANAKIHCQCLMQIIHCVFEKKRSLKIQAQENTLRVSIFCRLFCRNILGPNVQGVLNIYKRVALW
jgi:hypothetical protein